MSKPTAIIYVERNSEEIEVTVTAGHYDSGQAGVFGRGGCPSTAEVVEDIEACGQDGASITLTKAELELAEEKLLDVIHEDLKRGY